MKRILFFSLFLFLLLPGLAGAYEDSFESDDPLSNRYTTHYDTIEGTTYEPTISYSTDSTNASNVLLSSSYTMGGNSKGRFYITPIYTQNCNYFSFVHKAHSYPITGSTQGQMVIHIFNDTGGLIAAVETNDNYATDFAWGEYKVEVIKSGSYFDVYVDGTLYKSVVSSYPDYDGPTKYCIGMRGRNGKTYAVTYNLQIDDITDSSIIGTKQVITESNDNLFFTWSEQLKRSYSSSNHSILLYSITNPSNAGFIKSWNISSSTLEYGELQEGRESLLDLNYGLYQLQLTRNDALLTSTYFFYDNLASPVGYPECLFIAGANAEAEIKDQDLNGGTIEAGGTTYLYPSVSDSGIYNFTYNILEAPFSLEATIETVYNTSALNQTSFYFTGLSSQSYYVSIDGTEIESTHNADTWNYTFYNDSSNHVFSFDLDYKSPGVWGYIKNSETQSPIKSATVTISNSSNTYYITTDSNGMYYKTKDLITGSYNVSAAKSGYTSSLTYNAPTQENITTRQDIFLDPIQGSGVYYASHDVTFTVLEYWYSSAGLPDVSYAVYDDENESVKNGTTGSKGTFTVTDMDAGKNYTFILTYNNQTYTEYLEPGLTEYTLVLNKEGIVHQYFNSWLNLTYAENSNNATILYTSSKTVSEASFIVTASNGSQVQADTLNTTSGTFLFNFTEGDYILQFNIEASDGSTASQAWSVSSPPEVTLFPASYPTWLKNTLFVAIIIIFLLAFGKSKNDIACGAVAVLTSLGYYFEWLTCSFNFVVLIWIIALGAIFLHYKRTGAVG